MRRSLAPSQVGSGNVSVKKQKFIPPFLNPPSQPSKYPEGPKSEPKPEIISKKENVSVAEKKGRSTSSVLELLTKKFEEGQPEKGAVSEREIIKSPKTSYAAPLLKERNEQASNITGATPSTSRYFSVIWCKLSQRKHKKWEGDAIMIVQGRCVALNDMEGKEIGKASGYKISELTTLEEGQTLIVGGKEIEIMGTISEDSFKSGKCFQQACPSTINHPEPKPLCLPAKKAFVNPSLDKSSQPQNKPLRFVREQPYYDSSANGALVLPKPSVNHQWQYNREQLPVIDVVVDPGVASKMRPHQREGVIFLYECVMRFRNYPGEGAILADEMGLGKTLQCIALIWTLLKQGPYGGKPIVKKVLVITPSSLVKNWLKEFNKWLGKERISVFIVDQSNKPKDLKQNPLAQVVIISYEMFIRYNSDIQAFKFDLVVCDEGHRLKNTNIKTSVMLSQLNCEKRILLTGTPIQNDLQEFHAIVEFVNPGILGSTSAFHRIYEEPIVTSQQPNATVEEIELGKSRAEELSHLTGLFTLRRTQEVINKYLPPKIETVVFCKPSKLQCDLYQVLLGSHFTRECISMMGNGMMHLAIIMALKKICNHPNLVYKTVQDPETAAEEETLYSIFSKQSFADNDKTVFLEEHSGKLSAVVGLLIHLKRTTTERIVIVSHYTQTLNMFAEICKKYEYAYLRLDGSTSTAQRQNLVDRFNDPNCQDFIFLLSSKAGGVGLNLIGASRILLYDIDWNPANDLQAMSRVWRDGQRRAVRVYRFLTAGTIEEKVYLRQVAKQRLTGALADASESTKVKFSKEELQDLFTLHENTDCLTHQLMNCSCSEASNEKATPKKNSKDTARACQLGATSKPLGHNLTMDELMAWQHIPAPITEELVQDPSLVSGAEHISFVFQSTTNSVSPIS